MSDNRSHIMLNTLSQKALETGTYKSQDIMLSNWLSVVCKVFKTSTQRCSTSDVEPTMTGLIERRTQNSSYNMSSLVCENKNSIKFWQSGHLHQIPGQFGINPGHGTHKADSGTVPANPGRLAALKWTRCSATSVDAYMYCIRYISNSTCYSNVWKTEKIAIMVNPYIYC